MFQPAKPVYALVVHVAATGSEHTCICPEHVLAGRVPQHVLHELELDSGRRPHHHPHSKHDELAGGQGRRQEAAPVPVW